MLILGQMDVHMYNLLAFLLLNYQHHINNLYSSTAKVNGSSASVHFMMTTAF